MTAMTDSEMARVSGRALLEMGKVFQAGGTSGGVSFDDMTYYKAGLNAKLDLNMNIEKLQLGCTAASINGQHCDIDIDNLSLSGPDGAGPRPARDATLTRPFIELAIKNDHTRTMREVVGFRISAEQVVGLLTAGVNDGTANGINTFSGYMDIAASDGTTFTQAGNFTEPLSGRADVGGCIAGCPVDYDTSTDPLPLPSLQVDFQVPGFEVEGRRLGEITLAANANIPDIPLSGTRSAQMQGCFVVLIVPLCNYEISELNITGTLSGLSTDISIDEDLGYLHKIPVNNPFSLSFQRENINWPNAPAVARTGWWMAFNDPIDLGSLSTPPSFRVDISSAYPEVAAQVTQYLTDNPLYIPFSDAVGSLFTGSYDADVGVIDLSSFAPVNVNLANLPLGSAQDVTPNCYGSAQFC